MNAADTLRLIFFPIYLPYLTFKLVVTLFKLLLFMEE